jgi:hypothetical protein
MYKIAIIGSKDYVKESNVANFIKKIKNQFGPTATILSGGNDAGAETWVKKYSLELGFKFKEYNPSFTGYRMYSALKESYYGKGFHKSHFYDRYKRMIQEADKLVIFTDSNSKLHPDLEYAITEAKKKNISHVIIY